jgi:glycosyltransferase involved in cell wall biosynthesis
MRIALASNIEPTTTTGMGKWTERIAGELRALGHDVVRIDRLTSRVKGARVADHLYGLGLSIRLASERPKLDVVVVHEPHALFPALCSRLGLPPVVVMSHGVELRIAAELFQPGLRSFSGMTRRRWLQHAVLWGWREALAFRVGRRVLCLAELDRCYLLDSLGLEPERVKLMANGVDPIGRSVDPSLGKTVLCLGSWIPEKGSLVLPVLWRSVRVSQPSAKLVLLGTGQAREAVIAGFAPEDRGSIEVVPRFLELSEVASYFHAAGIFLLPSLREGSPLALLEAMAFGLPVVATSAGGIPDIIRDHRDGLLFPATQPVAGAELVVSLLRDGSQRRAFGEAARRRSAEHTWRGAALVVEQACIESVGGWE